jgi:GT2 family glycosyltransferase
MKPFSVIIATLNRTDFLLATLKDVVVQEYEPGFEVIIVDQSQMEDRTIQNFCKDYPFIHYHYITHFRGLPEARNFGAKQAKNPYLLFIDDDIECEPYLLVTHGKTLSEKQVAVVAGGVTEKYKANVKKPIGKFNRTTATPLRGFHQKGYQEVDHAAGGNFSVKKDIYIKVGGVDEHLSKGAALYEETDFCLRVKRAGYRIFFNYDAHVVHLAADTGGCRVPDINKYVFSLARNRSIIIQRYLPWYFQISAHLYLLKLVISFMVVYKSIAVLRSYKKGIKEGKYVGKSEIKNEQLK